VKNEVAHGVQLMSVSWMRMDVFTGADWDAWWRSKQELRGSAAGGISADYRWNNPTTVYDVTSSKCFAESDTGCRAHGWNPEKPGWVVGSVSVSFFAFCFY